MQKFIQTFVFHMRGIKSFLFNEQNLVLFVPLFCWNSMVFLVTHVHYAFELSGIGLIIHTVGFISCASVSLFYIYKN